MKRSRKIVIAGALALAAVGGAGGAVAASHAWGSDQRQAVINDAAGRLGVTPSALQNAFKGALKDQIEAAVTAGKLTRAQADAIEARIDAGQGLGFGGIGRGPGGPGGHGGPGGLHGILGPSLDAATTYLDLTEAQIRTQLQSGKTLAQIATAQGKTADGLIDKLVTAETAQLAKAVQDGHLTAAQQTQILANLKQRVTDMVNGTFGPGMHGGGFGGGPHNGFRQGYFRHSAARSTPKAAL